MTEDVPPSSGATPHVLVVDADGTAAEHTRATLERRLEVTTERAGDAAAALDRLDGAACVVSEYVLPDRDGLALFEAVRERRPDLPFVLFTDGGSEAVAANAVSAGVTDYVRKEGPADPHRRLADSVGGSLGPDAVADRRPRDGGPAAHRDVEETAEKVTAIHEFAHEVTDYESVEDVLAATVDSAERILEFDRSTASIRRGDRIVPVARSSSVAPDDVRSFEVGEGVTGQTVARQETIVVDDVRAASDASPNSTSVRSAISVPIGDHGTFQVTSKERNGFDRTDVEFAELLTSHAREAIERIKTETTLRRERDRLAALFENISQPAVRMEYDDEEFRVDEANAAYEETFGLSVDDLATEEIRERILPDDADIVPPETLIEQHEPTQFQGQRRTVDGVRDFLISVIPVEGREKRFVYGLYADIDEQKRIERTLRALHEGTREMLRAGDPTATAEVASRTAIDTLGFPVSGVRLYDEESGTLRPTAISDEALDELGDRPPIGPGDTLLWQAYEEGRVVVENDLAGADTRIDYPGLESLLIVPLGEHGIMPLGATEPDFFDDSDEYLAGVLGANLETALGRAKRTRQLHERDRQLQHEVDRLEKFAGVVSHDLRNPLSVAAGHLELARDRADDEALESHFESVAAAHDRMEQLIDDLLALAREGKFVDDAEPVSLADAASQSWQTVATRDADLAIETDATVEADPERLRTLLENLFRNSVEHAGDAVGVAVEPLADGGFAVTDDGQGLDIPIEEALEFGRTGSEDGTGLGLAIVREIAEAHGWTLEVGTSEAGGARFEFHT